MTNMESTLLKYFKIFVIHYHGRNFGISVSSLMRYVL